MTDAQITEAILQRVGQRGRDDIEPVTTRPGLRTALALVRGSRLVGNLFVEGGVITIRLGARGRHFVAPAVPNHEPTQSEIDDAAAFIWEAANDVT